MTELIDAFGLVLTPALPIIMMMAWCVPGWRCRIVCWLPWAALPPLMLALMGSDIVLPLQGFLFGTVLRLDDTSRVFLALSSLLWLGAGLYARDILRDDPQAGSFRLLWLACQSGNYGLILSADAASFYAAFALMTFAGYGLVIHKRTPEALRAGRIYLIMAVLGESMIITGLLLAAATLEAPLRPLLTEIPAAVAKAEQRDLIVAMLIGGFGVKAGLPFLHMWLPLAHPAAPVPASAVLSGAMIKAGVLGWLHTLPLGLISLPHWSSVLIGLGLLAAFGAALIGVNQSSPKTVLAYSSVSQMGLITTGLGIAAGAPEAWPLMLSAVTLYVLHHGLAKGALFLGTGLAGSRLPPTAQRLFSLGLALPALSLAGVMLSGASAKIALKHALEQAEPVAAWWAALPATLSLAAVGTSWLMARWWWLLKLDTGTANHSQTRQADRDSDDAPYDSNSVTHAGISHASQLKHGPGAWLGWLIIMLTGSIGFLLLFPGLASLPAPDKIPELLWPVIVATVVVLLITPRGKAWPIPAGDLIRPIEHLVELFLNQSRSLSRSLKYRQALTRRARRDPTDSSRRGVHLEQGLRRHAALMFAVLLTLMLLILITLS